MRILDRYLLRKFVHAYLVCFLSLVGLYVVIDAFSKIDEFSEQAASLGQTLQHMGIYYGVRLSLFFDQLSGVITMLAAMFTLSWLRRGGELTPILSAGIPIWRVAAPVLLAAVGAGGLAVANQEWVIPNFRLRLQRDADDPHGTKSVGVEGAYDYDTGVFLEAKRAYLGEKRLEGANVVLPSELAGSLRFLEAREAFYRPAQADQPAGWELVDTEPAELPHLPEAARETLRSLGPGRFFLVSHVTLEQMSRSGGGFQYASTAELIASLRNPSVGYGADQAVYLHSRLMRPVGNLLLLLLALPFVLSRESRNVFIATGLCLVLSVVYFGVTYGCQYLGNLEYVGPALAAWLPILLFGSVLPVSLGTVQT